MPTVAVIIKWFLLKEMKLKIAKDEDVVSFQLRAIEEVPIKFTCNITPQMVIFLCDIYVKLYRTSNAFSQTLYKLQSNSVSGPHRAVHSRMVF